MNLENVVFPGFIPEDDLPSLYTSADIFVLPSLWEVLPISLLEALASGLPLIATDAGGNPEILRDGVNGVMLPKRDPQAIVRAVERIQADPDTAESMRRNSREIALN